jgi:hypothetical protein
MAISQRVPNNVVLRFAHEDIVTGWDLLAGGHRARRGRGELSNAAKGGGQTGRCYGLLVERILGTRRIAVRHRAASIVLAGILAGLLAGCGATKTVTVTQTVTSTVTETTPTTVPAPTDAAGCGGSDLSGSFSEVPGSAGAGSITYALTLTNAGSTACYVSGIPQLQLLDASGGAVPTSVSAAQPGHATAAKIVLQPGSSARADARFSPDVPGPGEPETEPSPGNPQECAPTAHQLQVTVSGSSVTVPVDPPTAVCSHGTLRLSLLTAA